MKKHLRILSLILSVMMLLLVFASCSTPESQNNEGEKNENNESESETESGAVNETESEIESESASESASETESESTSESEGESEKESENDPENDSEKPIDHVGKVYRFKSEKFVIVEEEKEALVTLFSAMTGENLTVEAIEAGFSNSREGLHNDVYFMSDSRIVTYNESLSTQRELSIFDHSEYQLESTGRITGFYVSDIDMSFSADKRVLTIKVPLYLSEDGDITPAFSAYKSYSLITMELDEDFVPYDRMATAGKTYVSTSVEIRWKNESEKNEFYTVMGKTYNAYISEFESMIESKNYPYTYVFDADGIVNVFGDTPCGMKLYPSAYARTEFNGYVEAYRTESGAEKGYDNMAANPYSRTFLSPDGKTLTAEIKIHDDLRSMLVVTCTYDEAASALKKPTLALQEGYFLGSYVGVEPDFTVDKIKTESNGQIVFECRHERSEEGGPDLLVEGLPDEFGDYYLRVAVKPDGEYGWGMAEFEFYVEQTPGTFMEQKLGIDNISSYSLRYNSSNGNYESSRANLEAGKTYVFTLKNINIGVTSFSCHWEDDEGNWINVTSPDWKPMRLFTANGYEIEYDMWDDQDIILEYDVSGNKYFTLNVGEGCIFLITPTENIENFVLSAF